MLYIIAGEDIVSSRKKLTELLSEKQNTIRLDGTKATIAELDEALLGESLFSDSKVVVLENFSKLKPEAKVLDLIKKYSRTPVNGSKKSIEIILWDDVDISKKKFPKGVKLFNFLFPKFYYAFLDSFELRSKDSLKLLRDVLKTFEPEQALYGLVRRIRQLLVMKSNNYSDFSEIKRMQSWQISKLRKQASLWSEEQLKKVFLELAELDEKIKTSSLSMPLASHLDILLLPDLN